jgi:E3 ubiquitin-protein ligase HERC1
MLNPDAHSANNLLQFRFLGIMFGVAIRTKKPLEIHLAPAVWRQLAGQKPRIIDLEEMDTHMLQTLRCIEGYRASEFELRP